MKLAPTMIGQIHQWIEEDAECQSIAGKLRTALNHKYETTCFYVQANRRLLINLGRGVRKLDYRLSLKDSRALQTKTFNTHVAAHRKIWLEYRHNLRIADTTIVRLSIKLAKRQGYLRSKYESGFVRQAQIDAARKARKYL